LAVNKLAINLSSTVVDNQYFKVLIVPKAFIAEVLRDLFAMFDCFSIRVELKADAISHRDAVFHIEKKLSHGQSLDWAVADFSSLRGPPTAIAFMQMRETTRLRSGYYSSKDHAEADCGRQALR
jgi:hypothetical protein